MTTPPTLAERAARGYFHRPAVMAATPRGQFITSKSGHARRTHLVAETCAVWRHGKFERLAASTKCRRYLVAVEVHRSLPSTFELCDYCALADEFGPAGTTAIAVLARFRQLVPVARVLLPTSERVA